jgi:Limiting CO2-inducible proteins B/C beta carbonyic anhydrases
MLRTAKHHVVILLTLYYSTIRRHTHTQTLLKIGQAFPGAMSNEELLAAVTDQLAKKGFLADTTLVASSFCSDEVNRPLEDTFENFYGNHFAMGGLAGFPFSGVTGFGAMASHIPDGGNALLVYGPHVGVDSDGLVGKVNRRGKAKSGTCCGSAVAATKYLKAVVNGQGEIMPPPGNALDAQQVFVSNMLLPYASEITESENPMVTLPFLTFKPIDNMMNRIVAQMSTKVGEKGRIAMLGGLQVRARHGVLFCLCVLLLAVSHRTFSRVSLGGPWIPQQQQYYICNTDQHPRWFVGLLFAVTIRCSRKHQ